jgi:hypothetical protein
MMLMMMIGLQTTLFIMNAMTQMSRTTSVQRSMLFAMMHLMIRGILLGS